MFVPYISRHHQRDTKNLLQRLPYEKNLRLREAAHNDRPIQCCTPQFLNLFLWEAEEGKAQDRSTHSTRYNSNNWFEGHTQRLDLKASRLKFTPSSVISFCYPQSTPHPSPSPLSGTRPGKKVQTALPFSIVPINITCCYLCTLFYHGFDAVSISIGRYPKCSKCHLKIPN